MLVALFCYGLGGQMVAEDDCDAGRRSVRRNALKALLEDALALRAWPAPR